ncbi:hypothetical protein L1987_84513 [Smallanthus sonchifolius]|uniref:Uncharacterized protein n=1 Tax=Smallanthus sonchifolius TaxID=185202 RepID=A0ACB8YE70_9ASTR|nr:hypothetical protein L1987_84513 [Smallanthus sonchifolius]
MPGGASNGALTPKSLIVAPQMSVIPNYWERTDEAENSDDPKESLNTLIRWGKHNHWDDELNFHIVSDTLSREGKATKAHNLEYFRFEDMPKNVRVKSKMKP